MTALVADTHAVVWYIEASSKLSSTAFKTMQSALQAGQPIYVSSVSMVEIAYLTEKGRLPKELLNR